MPVSNVNFTGDNSPTESISSIMSSLEAGDAEVVFGDGKIDRTYIEMVVNDYADKSGNPAVAKKWVQIDTELEKQLKRFKIDLKNLMNTIQNSPVVEAPQAPQQQAQQSQVPTQQGPAQARKLPEPLV